VARGAERSGEGRFSRRGAEAQGGRFFTTTGATGSKGEEAVGASLTLLSWLLKSGVLQGGAVRGREVLPQGRRGAGGKVFNNDGSDGEQRGGGGWGVAVVAVVVVKVGWPAGRSGPGREGFPAGARRRRGG
jgi:hypothetical protein